MFTYHDITPEWTGFSVNPSNVTYRYAVKDSFMHLYLYVGTNGTSAAGAPGQVITLQLPPGYVAKKKISFKTSQAVNNGSAVADAHGQTNEGSATLDFYTSSGGAAWTSGGNKRIAFSVAIEVVKV